MNLLVSLSLGDAVPSSFTTVQVQKIGVPRQLSENSRKFQSWIAVLQIAFLNGPNPTLRECRFLHRVTADGELDWARSPSRLLRVSMLEYLRRQSPDIASRRGAERA